MPKRQKVRFTLSHDEAEMLRSLMVYEGWPSSSASVVSSYAKAALLSTVGQVVADLGTAYGDYMPEIPVSSHTLDLARQWAAFNLWRRGAGEEAQPSEPISRESETAGC